MAIFYLIRHGQMDFSQAGTKFYQSRGFNMLPLSETGIAQMEAAARDPRLKEARLIITSPFGRTLHSAAILSRALGVELRVETDLHEWVADAADYAYLPQEEANRRYQELTENHGRHPEGGDATWESAAQMKRRLFSVLEKYRDYRCVIVSCHGTLMQYALDIPHPSNGQIVKLEY